MPRGEGHARFDAFDLARMLAMKSLADRGIGPSHTHELAEWCGYGIVFNAIAIFEAWEGELDNAPIDHPLRAANFDNTLDHLSGKARDAWIEAEISAEWWGRLARYLRNGLWRQLGKPQIAPGAYFIWWPDGDHRFDESLESAFDGKVGAPGAAVVLDFRPLARLLIDRAGRALCHVEFETTE